MVGNCRQVGGAGQCRRGELWKSRRIESSIGVLLQVWTATTSPGRRAAAWSASNRHERGEAGLERCGVEVRALGGVRSVTAGLVWDGEQWQGWKWKRRCGQDVLDGTTRQAWHVVV